MGKKGFPGGGKRPRGRGKVFIKRNGPINMMRGGKRKKKGKSRFPFIHLEGEKGRAKGGKKRASFPTWVKRKEETFLWEKGGGEGEEKSRGGEKGKPPFFAGKKKRERLSRGKKGKKLVLKKGKKKKTLLRERGLSSPRLGEEGKRGGE